MHPKLFKNLNSKNSLIMTDFLINISKFLQNFGGLIAIVAAIGMSFLEHYGHKPNKKTFAIIICIGGIFSLIGACYSSVDNDRKTATIIQQNEKIATLSDSTNTQVSSIKGQLNNAQSVLDIQLHSLDSLNIKLNESTASALKSIETTKQAVLGFNNVSEQLKKATELEKLKLFSDGPDFVLNAEPFFTLKDTADFLYSITVPIENIGKRTADVSKINALFVESTNGYLHDPFLITPQDYTGILVPSAQSGGEHIIMPNLFVNFSTLLEYETNGGFLAVHIVYSDPITNKPDERIQYYFWNTFKKSKNYFQVAVYKDREKIINYIKDNKIKI